MLPLRGKDQLSHITQLLYWRASIGHKLDAGKSMTALISALTAFKDAIHVEAEFYWI
jgi:hypothetical protein